MNEKKTQRTKRIKKGRFYLVFNGSLVKHPGMIVWKKDKRNLYLAVVTGTTNRKGMMKLNKPTSQDVTTSYIKRRPFLGKQKDFGKVEMNDMKFSKEDKPLIKATARREPEFSRNIKYKDKRYIKRLMNRKKKPYFWGQLSGPGISQPYVTSIIKTKNIQNCNMH